MRILKNVAIARAGRNRNGHVWPTAALRAALPKFHGLPVRYYGPTLTHAREAGQNTDSARHQATVGRVLYPRLVGGTVRADITLDSPRFEALLESATACGLTLAVSLEATVWPRLGTGRMQELAPVEVTVVSTPAMGTYLAENAATAPEDRSVLELARRQIDAGATAAAAKMLRAAAAALSAGGSDESLTGLSSEDVPTLEAIASVLDAGDSEQALALLDELSATGGKLPQVSHDEPLTEEAKAAQIWEAMATATLARARLEPTQTAREHLARWAEQARSHAGGYHRLATYREELVRLLRLPNRAGLEPAILAAAERITTCERAMRADRHALLTTR
ncbi:hypothetical protein DYH09_13850 [bacterium CPR1]|nr:hypothetical protein [bacterium CPR1]